MAVEPNPEDLRPHRLVVNLSGEYTHQTAYCIENGVVTFRGRPVRGADRNTFEFYTNAFAKDAKACYSGGSRLAGADASRFRPLNYTYVTDGNHVWCIGGQVKNINVKEFQVCDDGRRELDALTIVPYGYGRDSTNVCYYDFSGVAHLVRGADAKSFRSLGDGIYGLDDQCVFVAGKRLKGVKSSTWRKIAGIYSTDGKAIFYFDSKLEGADLATFKVVPSRFNTHTSLAMDANHRYLHGTPVGENAVNQEYWLTEALVELAAPASDA